MRTISLCTPVWGRYELTELLLRERVRTFDAARELGVQCHCVVIGDDDNLDTARELGFATIEAPNVLGSKYNDGHEWAVRNGFDVSFQVNSDQTFDPRLLVAVANASDDRIILTRWLTAIHSTGTKAITTFNPIWAMTAYPRELLSRAPRPCPEAAERMCDTGTFDGVRKANPGAEIAEVILHEYETLQFETPTQLTPWSRHQKVALTHGAWEYSVPWPIIAAQHGEDFADEMARFYGVNR